MNWNKPIGVGLVALLVVALVLAANATEDLKNPGRSFFRMRGFAFGRAHEGMNKTAFWENLGVPENATREQVEEALWEKQLEDLGLTEDSTVGEYRLAMKARMQARQEQMQARMQEQRTEMLEKLGLGEDATPEEMREARQNYCSENPDDCPCGMKAGFGHGMRGHMI